MHENESYLHTLAMMEPWRTGQGNVNALDPTWLGAEPTFCRGVIYWEAKTEWWICKTCGYVSRSTYLEHRPVERPITYFAKSAAFYFKKRAEQKVPLSTSIGQLLFVAGTAIRYAAITPPEEISKYARTLVVA